MQRGGALTRNLFLIFPTIHKVVVMSLERVCAPGRVLWKGTDIESSCFFLFLKNTIKKIPDIISSYTQREKTLLCGT